MTPDPALEIVREARRQISRDVNNDASRLVDRYRKMQAAFSGRLILGPESTGPQPSSAPTDTDGPPTGGRRAAG